MEFHKILKALQEERGLTISELARTCGLSDSTIRTIFVRKNKSVTLDVALKLSKGLHVSIDRLNSGTSSDDENNDYLSPLDTKLMGLISLLSEDQKKMLIAQLKIMLQN